MDAPLWLQDEPEILALLSAVLDRLDQQSGDARQRAIMLPAEKYLTALRRGDEQADQIWAFVNELSHHGVLAIRYARRNPYDSQWKGAKLAFSPAVEPNLRLWLGRPASASHALLWRRAVEKYAPRFPAGHELLLARRIVIPGRTAEEVVAAFASLMQVQRPATLRQLSTLAFWGNSKILDDRGDLVAALFPKLEVRERPIVVAAYLPNRVEGALFIENLDTYSAAIEGQPAATGNHALIYMAGFRGAALRIRSRQGARLHFAGPGRGRFGEEFERWWFDAAAFNDPLYFWGDLDFAGMQILKSLRQRFALVEAWRPGYEPMLADLRAARVNVATSVDVERQVDPVATGCTFADEVLLPAIREHGFWDQERIAAD